MRWNGGVQTLVLWMTGKFLPCKSLSDRFFLVGINIFFLFARPTWRWHQRWCCFKEAQKQNWLLADKTSFIGGLKVYGQNYKLVNDWDEDERWMKPEATKRLTKPRTDGGVWRPPINARRLKVKTAKVFQTSTDSWMIWWESDSKQTWLVAV